MNDLEQRLTDLGDQLALDDDQLVADVLARLGDGRTADQHAGGTHAAGMWLRVAAVVGVALAMLVAIPSSRRAIAEWFGLDGVEIERDPELSVPAGSAVPGNEILVDEVDVGSVAGRLDGVLLSKTLAGDTGIARIDIDGRPGLWIDGEPHLVSYRSAEGDLVEERFAGNTLLWQDGDVIHRVEGFSTMQDAIAFAREHTSATQQGTD